MKKFIVLIILVLLAAGCGAEADAVSNTNTDLISDPGETTNEPSTPKPLATPSPTPSAKPTPSPSPAGYSALTGEAVTDKDAAEDRPIAVVINNLDRALPQSGIGQAGIIYEVLAEGGITRLVCLFQGAVSERIGPIRSARHYFIRFALDNNAIFAHHGGSDQAYSQIRSMDIESIDGMKYDGSLYWRDPERVKQRGMYEHSSYSSIENLKEAAELEGYSSELSAGQKPMFGYDPEAAAPKGKQAETVTVTYSPEQSGVFEYDDESALYLRSQNGSAHIDEETGDQLSVTNVIIQQAEIYIIAGDEYGRREARLVGSGGGWLASGGRYIPITWEKESDSEQTKWFNTDGSELKLKPGKTWICVLQDSVEPVFE